MTSVTHQPSPRSRSQASSSGGRRSTTRNGPPTHLQHHSDCPPEDSADQNSSSPGLGQRSISLTTLQQPTVVIEPRMAQLETLEAKMASIEVSLSSTPRRKKNGSLGGVSLLGSSIRSIPKEIAVKELESLRNALRDKENIIQSLKGQLTIPGLRLTSSVKTNGNNNANNNGNKRELTEIEKKQAEERLNRLKIDIDNKRLAIKNLKMALERLDITDNIDVRIQQAELEYQLGREELNLLTLLEETRALQLILEESNKSCEAHTLFSCVNGGDHVILLGVEVDYDPKSPKFGAGQKKDSSPGLWIDWALEETGMCKGDRLVEVNGKVVLTKNRDDLNRLLAAAPDPAQIVILRRLNQNGTNNFSVTLGNTHKDVASLRSELEVVRERAEEAQKTKDGLISDNIRLTHRISYLEEQVSELLCRKKSGESDVRILTNKSPVISTVETNKNVTNISITTPPISTPNSPQVFQKGPQVTALVANLPGLETNKESHTSLPVRSKSSLSNVSNTHIPAPSPQPDYHCHKSHRHKHHRSRHSLQGSTQNLVESGEKITYRKHHTQNHHHHHREKDYNSETNSAVEAVARYNKRNTQPDYNNTNGIQELNGDTNGNNNIMDQSYKKATKIVHELTRNREATNLYEKHRQKCITASEKYYNSDILKHYNARKSSSVFRSEIHIGNNGKKYQQDSKSAENLDCAIENNTANVNLRFKKIQDARSAKSLDFDSDCNSTTNGYNSSSTTRGGYAKSVDYTSEPIENRKLSYYNGYYSEGIKPRPTPPKKPLRLSLHKTHSLQSVESTNPSEISSKNECRKRNYKGETPICNGNGHIPEAAPLKWSSFGNNARKTVENGPDTGRWC